MANTIVIPDVAKIRLMKQLMTGSNLPIDGNAYLHYFASPLSLGADTVLADFTEISFDGYSAYLLSGAADQGIVTGDYDQWLWPVNYMEATGGSGLPETAYGYWVTASDDGALLWCQKFDVPYTWAVVGDTLPFQPALYTGEILS